MNKNKWFLNGGRGSGKSIRLLCETYENKIVELQNKVDTLQGFLDHDIEYDMDKTIQEQKIKIAELEKKNKVLAQNLEDTEIINAELKTELSENKVADCHIVNGLCEQLTKAKEIIKQLMKAIPYGSGKMATEAYDKAEQFLNSEVEK